MAEYPTKFDQILTGPEIDYSIYGGSFHLRELSLHSPSNPSVVHFNSAGVFIELNIFEDLFSNVLKGTFVFVDNQGIAETFPIIGDETLVLSFHMPGVEDPKPDTLESGTRAENIIKQQFKVYDCVEVETEERAKFYKLFFVSEEYVSSIKMKISKGYKGKLFGAPLGGKDKSIVEDILTKMNKNIDADNQKKVYIEKTAIPQNVIIPNWTPFQAINFCASRSVSDNSAVLSQGGSGKDQKPFAAGSLFVFYEKLGTGFFYESIESMILHQKTQRDIPLYLYMPKTAEGVGHNVERDFFGVEKYEVKSSFKTLENLGMGMYGSRLIAYDPIRMKYDEIKYDYYKKEENPVTQRRKLGLGAVQEKPEPSQAKDDSTRIFADFIATDIDPTERTQNKLISTNSEYLGSNDASINLATTTKNHDAMFVADSAPYFPKTSIGATKKTFKDQEAKSNRVENWLLQRKMQLQEFGNIIVNFTVPGNSSRHVGDLIQFELPTMIPPDAVDDMSSIDIGHQLYSGYYLISKIRHSITPNRYETDMELIKNSFAKRIPGQEAEAPSLKKRKIYGKIRTPSAIVAVKG